MSASWRCCGWTPSSPPPRDGVRNDDATYVLPLGPLPPLQDKVEVLGYPEGGGFPVRDQGRCLLL